tara:strand:+ start:54 stop:293 length:240 start_codon:yes stop_codon:yes gene_type:complete
MPIPFKPKPLALFLCLATYFISAQTPERSVLVKKIDQEIVLDGKLNEVFWQTANSADNFWQLFPTDSLKYIQFKYRITI